jgi:hypothetical protein
MSSKTARFMLLVGLSALAGGAAATFTGGCQLLSGISDLEATGGASSTGTTSSKASSTSGTTNGSTTASSSGTGCPMPGNPTYQGCTPPFCENPGQSVVVGVECQLGCETQDPLGACTPGGSTGSGPMPGLPMYCSGQMNQPLDTNIAPMHVQCTGVECNNKTFTCQKNAMAPGDPLFPCIVECTNGACSTNTTLDCTQTQGPCQVKCTDPGSCSGLTLKCGSGPCLVTCGMAAPGPAMVTDGACPHTSMGCL